jgi:hypothetical protein
MKRLQVFADLVANLVLVFIRSIEHPLIVKSLLSTDPVLWLFGEHFHNQLFGFGTSFLPDLT